MPQTAVESQGSNPLRIGLALREARPLQEGLGFRGLNFGFSVLGLGFGVEGLDFGFRVPLLKPYRSKNRKTKSKSVF